jgi:fructokinase
MPDALHALVIGEALVDVVRRADGSESAHPGGSPANVAIGLARLGRTVELLTSIGDDAYGASVRAHIEASGARLAHGSLAPRTSVATATVDEHGLATYDFDLAWAIAADAATTPGPIVVHTGSIAAVLEPGATSVADIVLASRQGATVTYDPNVRPSLMGDRADAVVTIERLVCLADVVKVSDEDLAWLFPGEKPADAASRWLGLGPALVVVTLGAEGALAVCGAGQVTAPPVRVTVADTVGAGDSFMSGLIDGLWSHGLLGADHRGALRAIDHGTVEQILARCARIAGITVSRAGANPPTSAELGESERERDG